MPYHRIILYCPVCGKSLSLRPSEAREGRHYCSRTCADQRRHLRRRSAAERFWEKVERRGPDECWFWQGCKLKAGYGLFRPDPHSRICAHRFAWELTYGEIPKALCVCHHCDQPACVNVAHLFLGTDNDNKQDSIRKGRSTGKLLPATLIEGYPHAKLTGEQVRAIRNRRNERSIALAVEYGISRTTVYRIWREATWKHLL